MNSRITQVPNMNDNSCQQVVNSIQIRRKITKHAIKELAYLRNDSIIES